MKKATEMTINELVAAARNYDNVVNEGGEGYNPYNNELERRAAKEEAKRAAEHAATPQGRLDALYRRVERECGSVAREWGNNEEIDALQSSLYAEIDKIKAEMESEFLMAWTLDITKARREEWNNFVKAEIIPINGTPKAHKALYQRQQDQGWTMNDLKKAVALHGLNK